MSDIQPAESILKKAQIWQDIGRKAYGLLSFAQLKKLYDVLFENEPLPVAWIPDQTSVNSNISRMMKKLDIHSYHSFHQWSVSHRKQFWKKAIEQLDIRFAKPYKKIVNLEQGVEHADWLPGATLNIVQSCFTARPDKIALVVSDENNNTKKYTYQQLELLTRQVASGLRAIGLQPQDRVVLYLPLNMEAVVAYLGIIRAGMTAVLVADSFSPQELKKRHKLSEAKAIITVDEYQYNGKQLAVYDKVQTADSPMAIVVTNTGEPALREGDLLWNDFLGDEQDTYHFAEAMHMISLLFSSGTTKDPKAIPWTQTTPIKCATDALYHQDVHPDDVITWTTGMGWMMAPWVIFAAMMNKATLALFTGSAASKAFGAFVEKAGITILGTIPSLVKVWRNTGCMESFQWPVRIFSSTGEPSNAEDYLYLMWLAQFRAPVIEYCGGTEIGGGYFTGSVMQPASPGTFTTPALGLQLVFKNEETGAIGNNQEGEVFIVPPSIGLSQHLLNRDHHEEYFAHALTLENGTPLRKHGDNYYRVAQVGDTVFYKSQGRADDVMNLGGIKVSAVELETVLNEHPMVFETAAVAIAPEGGGPEQLLVFYVPTEEQAKSAVAAQVLQKQLQQKLSDELNPLFRIKEIIAQEHLPRTASNKLMRRKLRAMYR